MARVKADTAVSTRMVGLFGYPVEHSLSPVMHNASFEVLGLPFKYVLLPASPEEFGSKVAECLHTGFVGWNVTVPHKERMVPLLHEASDAVRATGACNTVRVEDGRLVGSNTDVYGFLQGLREAGGIEPGSRAVVLGGGGAARGVVWALASSGHDVLVLSRRAEQAAALSEFLGPHVGAAIDAETLEVGALNAALVEASLLVNATPAGQCPHEEGTPLPEGSLLHERLLIYDLVYTPRPTRLLREAAEAGCRTQDGLAMLVYQGAEAFRTWTGQEPPVELMRQVVTRNA